MKVLDLFFKRKKCMIHAFGHGPLADAKVALPKFQFLKTERPGLAAMRL